METTLTINIPAPSARARGAGGGGKEEKEKIKVQNTSYKVKFHITRNKYEKVTAAHKKNKRKLEVANAIVKNLQAENDLLLDAMLLADPGLYDRYFSTTPGTVPFPLDPYTFPELIFVPPPPQSSSSSQPHYSLQHARYQPPPHSNPYPYPSSSAATQAIAGPSSSSHHPQRPHYRDHYQQLSKTRRGDVGPSPPEELGLVGMQPSASSASNTANPSSIPVASEFDPQYDNPYRRTSRMSAGHPSHLNGNNNGTGGSGHGTNGVRHIRSEHPVDDNDDDDDDDDDMMDVPPEVVNGRS